MGAFQREIAELPQERALETLRSDYHLDEFAAGNVFRYLNEQREATRAVPSDRTVVIERFRDEIGDWRLCVLTPFGGACTPPGRWRCRPGCATSAASTRTRSGPTTG